MNTGASNLTKTVGAEGERVRIEVEHYDLGGAQRITGRVIFDNPENTPVLDFTAFDGDVERVTHGLRYIIAMIEKADELAKLEVLA